ncbi:MAG: alpha/beta fold hydrolase [Planctomycetes bacterium]|nr:alpha/beta fold hydrolase [Planctomycetota bacterium]
MGTYTPPAADPHQRRGPMVILLHMYGQDRSTWDPLVPVLHRAGFAVLAIDLRGHGESVEPASLKLRQKVEERDPRLFREMVDDVAAAYRWLARRPEADPARFVLAGASVGCSIALEYAVRDRSVDGVVCLTPGADYLGLDSLASARKYSDRKLLLLAAAEERSAAEEIGRLVPGAQVRIVAGRTDVSRNAKSDSKAGGKTDVAALHGTRMFGAVAGVEKLIVDFLTEAAGSPSDKTVVASTKGEVYYEPGSSPADRLSPDNLRVFSSPAEAQTRGYRPPKQRAR